MHKKMKGQLKNLFIIIVFVSFFVSVPNFSRATEDDIIEKKEWQISSDIKAKISDDMKTLSITGKGAIKDFAKDIDMPWYTYKNLIENVEISQGITSIGRRNFYSCSNLKNITIPDSVENIGEGAFRGCSLLEEIIIPQNLKKIERDLFFGCHNLKTIIIPQNVSSIGEQAFFECTSLSQINIPKNVKTIRDSAFYNCVKLKNITIPENVEYIGLYSFYGCNSLEKIELPKKTQMIGSATFYGCSSLVSVKIPEGIKAIESNAFRECKNLVSIEIPKSVEIIEDDALGKNDNVVIYCDAGSVAEKYAQKNGKTVKYIKHKINYYCGKDLVFKQEVFLNGNDLYEPDLGEAIPKGYHLDGWSTDSNANEPEFSNLKGKVYIYKNEEEINLYAIFAPNKYHIWYYPNGTIGQIFDSNHIYGEPKSIIKNPYKKNGYTLKGWNTKADGSGKEYGDEEKIDLLTDNEAVIKLYAQWTPNNYMIKYDANGGIGKMEDSNHIYDRFKRLAENLYTREGYTFNSWNTSPEGEGTSYTDEQLINLPIENNSIITLYAQWLPNKYIIQYKPNGATEGEMEYSEYLYDEVKNLATNSFKRKYTVTLKYNLKDKNEEKIEVNYIFDSWNTQKDKNGTKFVNEEPVTNLTTKNDEIIVLYAQWNKEKITLPAPQSEGYTFDGWYKDSNCKYKIGDGDSTYIPEEDIVLYAKWNKISDEPVDPDEPDPPIEEKIEVKIKENPKSIKRVINIDSVDYAIVNKGTTVENILEDIDINSENYKLIIKDNQLLEDKDKIKTSSKIELENHEDEFSMIFVVEGDINSDGNVNFKDILKLNNIRISLKEGKSNWSIPEKIAFKCLNGKEVKDSIVKKIEFRNILELNNYRLKKR